MMLTLTEGKGFMRTRLAYLLFGLLIVGGHLAILFATVDNMGLTDDDDFYVPAGVEQADYFAKMVTKAVKGDFSYIDHKKIANSFRIEHRHPGVAKSMMGLTYLIFNRILGWYDKMDAARIGIMLFAVWIVYMIFRMGWEIFGARVGIFASLAFILLPRSFFHSHVGTLDIAVTATYLSIIYYCWRAQRGHWIYIILTGVMYGVAMATKLNAPFAILPMLLFWAYRWRQVSVLGENAPMTRKRIIWIILSVGTLSLPVFFILWPWLWVDTVDRFIEYVRFHMNHYGILLLYLGDIYNDPFAPWHAPFVYTGVATPFVTLLLGLSGFFIALRSLNPLYLLRFPGGLDEKRDFALLFAVNAFICIGVVAFPNNPKYGGVKLWQPMFPFFVLLAGYAFDIMLDHLGDIAKLGERAKKIAFPVALALCLTPAFIGMMRNYPDLLTYFNELAGNLPGAAEMGMERQYYDQCYKSYIEYWNSQEQWKSIVVSYEPNQHEYQRTYPWYQRMGKLRKDVRFAGPDRARFMILTHERRWPRYPDILQEYRNRKEIYTHSIWGVPLYTIYDLKPEEDRKKPPKPRDDKAVRKPGAAIESLRKQQTLRSRIKDHKAEPVKNPGQKQAEKGKK